MIVSDHLREVSGVLMLEEKRLIWRFNRGSAEAFEQIYERYVRVLYTAVVLLVRDRCAAEDLVQDTFVKFARSAGRVRLRGSLKAYLVTCAVNRARDWLSRQHRRECLALQDLPSLHTPDPQNRAEWQELCERLTRALGQVPDEQREVIVLHLQGGQTFRAIARDQQVPVQTVVSRYRYGIGKLRTFLNGELL